MTTLKLQFAGKQLLRNSFFLISMLLFSGAAMADRPEWAGRGGDSDGERMHKNKHKQGEGRDRDDDDRRDRRNQDRYQSNQGSAAIKVGGYFGESQRTETQEYYSEESRAGRCPPGLAKKHNGCMPPGQAKKWAMGKSLSREVSYLPIEPEIQIKLGMPPAGHKFVRVASDILLIAVGSGMVVDAIQDIGRLHR